MTLSGNKLTPAKGKHLKNAEGMVFEGCVYLGCHDAKSNYSEVSEKEYREYLENIRKEQDAYAADISAKLV